MAITQLRGNTQVKDNTVTRVKLVNDFVDGATWNLSSTNTALLDGLGAPTGPNMATTKSYVDGLVDSGLKSPDGFATNVAGDYPTDYKGTGAVNEGDMFYVTDVTNGTTVGSKTVNLGDALVSISDNPGNTDANWIIMESNRDQATESVKGVAQIATGAQTSIGVDDTTIVTPLKLAGALLAQAKTAGAGLTDTAGTFDVVATNASLIVNADDMGVQVGTTHGTSLDITATGLELASSVTGNRAFTNGIFDVSAGGNAVSIGSTTSVLLDSGADLVTLSNQPTGGTALAISTTKYVDDKITASTITASNGLTKTGNDITLGGTLTTNTTIDGANNNLTVTNLDTMSLGIDDGSGNTGELYVGTGTGHSIAQLSAVGGAGTVRLTLDAQNGASITASNAGSPGIIYGGNYNSNFIARSLVDKEYVDTAIASVTTEVYGETPAVTNGSADITLANTPTAGTLRVYLNGLRQNGPGAGDDFTLSGTTVTFASALSTGDIVVVDYKY